MAAGYDPLEAVKVTPKKVPAAPPPVTPSISAVPPAPPDASDLERLRHEREGTPIMPVTEAAPVQTPPAEPPPRPNVDRFRVRATKVINLRGHLTTLAKGSVVSEVHHDLAALRAQNVELELLERKR